MITTLFFDAADTLFFLPRSVGSHYREVALRHGCHIDAAALTRAFGAAFRVVPPRPSSRTPREDDDKEWWRVIVLTVLAECGVGPGEMDRDAYFEDLYGEFAKPGVWELFPDVRPTLEVLHRQFRLGVLSNFDSRLRPILGHLGIAHFFNPIIISSEVGAEKPDPWIFAEALRQTGVPPTAAMHIGDDPKRDWQAAAAAGLHAFQLDRPRNSLHDLVVQLTGRSAS